VLLCQPSDDPAQPHPPAYYEALFAPGTPDLLWDYFHRTSGGRVDISGSRVLGWFRMNVDKATVLARNNSTPVNRRQTAIDCRAAAVAGLAAQGLSIDMNRYVGVITAMNVYADSGQAGARDVVINHDHPRVEVGFIVHEMLHVLGLPHSFLGAAADTEAYAWQSAGITEYNDCMDMMSFRTCVLGFNSARGFQGPGLNAGYLDRLGWLAADRKLLMSSGEAGRSVTLQSLSRAAPGAPPGLWMVRVGLYGGGAYLIEYREPVGLDRGASQAGIQIRQWLPAGRTVLVQKRNGSGSFLAGETFRDPANMLSIRIDALQPGQATITVDPSHPAGGLPAGARCGDRAVGQVQACVPGTECRSRRIPGGMLQTVDWYCQ
jgi:hypothetical protein